MSARLDPVTGERLQGTAPTEREAETLRTKLLAEADQCRSARTAANLAYLLRGFFGYSFDELIGQPRIETASPPIMVPATADTSRIVRAASADSLDFLSWAENDRVAPAVLEHIASELRRIAIEYVHRPMPPLFSDLVDLPDTTFRPAARTAASASGPMRTTAVAFTREAQTYARSTESRVRLADISVTRMSRGRRPLADPAGVTVATTGRPLRRRRREKLAVDHRTDRVRHVGLGDQPARGRPQTRQHRVDDVLGLLGQVRASVGADPRRDTGIE